MKRSLALALALLMTLSLLPAGADAKTAFTDDAAIRCGEAVEVLSGIGVLGGYDNGDGSYAFRPQGTLTRGAGMKIIAYLVLGQGAADRLKASYTVFTDVTKSVSLAAYIEWAAGQGIVEGYGNGRFGPYDTLTQYAFGKMLLTALGYSASREGFTGSGWQRNVCALAEETGVFDGTESAGACLRETAARMALGALRAKVVAYSGDAVNGGYYWRGRRVEVDDSLLLGSGAFAAVSTLGELYGLEREEVAADAWGAPAHRWVYAAGGWSALYEEEPVLRYTGAVDECRLLTDLGVAAGSSAFRTVDRVFYNALEDGTDIVLRHRSEHSGCGGRFFGGQGVLTRVYRQEDGSYLITETASYLARVDSVSGGSAAVTVYYRDLSGFGRREGQLPGDQAASEKQAVLASSAYAPGDWLLVRVNAAAADAACIAEHRRLSGVSGRLTAASNAGACFVDGSLKQEAFGFCAGYGEAGSASAVGRERSFFYDDYGNVIGMTEADAPAAVPAYAVAEAIWSYLEGGSVAVGADMVGLDGVTAKNVSVTAWEGYPVAVSVHYDDTIRAAWEDNRFVHCGHLYACAAEGEGWSLRRVTPDLNLGTVFRAAGESSLSSGSAAVTLTAETRFLLRDAAGGHRACTGYAALPALTAERGEVLCDGGSAAVVFLDGVAYGPARTEGVIAEPSPIGYLYSPGGVTYCAYTLYVSGAPKTVYVRAADRALIDGIGRYEMELASAGGLLLAASVRKTAAK